MFLLHALGINDKANELIDSRHAKTTHASDSSSRTTGEDVRTDAPDISKRYSSFIIGKNDYGGLKYREGSLTSAEELALVYEHAYDLVAAPIRVLTNKKAMEYCIDDFTERFHGENPERIIKMIRVAKYLSTQDNQKSYFEQHPFGFFTARSLYNDAWTIVLNKELEKANEELKKKQKIISGEAFNRHCHDILTTLNYIVRGLIDIRGVQNEHIRSFNLYIHNLTDDYPEISQHMLPKGILDGIRCLSSINLITIPTTLLEAVGDGPWPLNLDWIDDEKTRKAVREKWNELNAGSNYVNSLTRDCLPEPDED